MNKTIKIILLCVAIVIAIVSVMYYVKTIVSPPRELLFKNQYEENVKKDINKLQVATTHSTQDSLYHLILEEIGFQRKEDLINQQQRDILIDKFAGVYVPLFVQLCNTKFEYHVWYESDHSFMKHRISELNNLTINNGSKKVLEGESLNELSGIISIIDTYDSAKKAADNTSYKGIDNAREAISEAKRYAEMSPINNCTELVNNLHSVAGEIERNHFNYLNDLVSQVESYSSWSEYSYKDFLDFSKFVREKLMEYKNKTPFYGSHHDVDGLISRRDNIVDYAYRNYFIIETND